LRIDPHCIFFIKRHLGVPFVGAWSVTANRRINTSVQKIDLADLLRADVRESLQLAQSGKKWV
jgi:hypothetical protein